jgi:hypothetical protein
MKRNLQITYPAHNLTSPNSQAARTLQQQYSIAEYHSGAVPDAHCHFGCTAVGVQVTQIFRPPHVGASSNLRRENRLSFFKGELYASIN